MAERRAADGKLLPSNPMSSEIKPPLMDKHNGNSSTASATKSTKRKKQRAPKEVRQARREAAVLKELYAPKDSRVSLITPAMMRLFNSDSRAKSRQNPRHTHDTPGSEPKLTGQEFPTVSQSVTIIPKKTVPSFPIIEPQGNDTSTLQTPPAPTPSRKSKKNDAPSKNPIILNLEELIQCSSPSTPSEKRKIKKRDKVLLHQDVRKEMTKFTTNCNALDASRPVMLHRGKIRCNVRKRPTPLKKAILIARSLRRGRHEQVKLVKESEEERSERNVPFISSGSDVTANADAQVLDFNSPSSVHFSSETVLGTSLDSIHCAQSVSEPVPIAVDMTTKPKIVLEPDPQAIIAEVAAGIEGIRLEDTDDDSQEVPKEEPERLLLPPEVEKRSIESADRELVSSTPKTDIDTVVPDNKPDCNEKDYGAIFRKLLDEALLSAKTGNSETELKEFKEDQVETEEHQKVDVSVEVLEKAKKKLHKSGRKWRSYCDMYTSKELHGEVIALLLELHRFQDRLYHSDPIKYQNNKRYVHGMKEIIAGLERRKIELLIIAPDVEPTCSVKGGLDDKIEEVLTLAKANGIPYLFSGHRFILGKPIRIKRPVSVIGIQNKQGAEELVEKVMKHVAKLRALYCFDLNACIAQVLEEQSQAQRI